jgi:hypothetical protein
MKKYLLLAMAFFFSAAINTNAQDLSKAIENSFGEPLHAKFLENLL